MRSIAFLAPDFLANPWPGYARFREERPVWWSDEIRMFCVFRHRDIRACLTGADYTVEYPFRVSRQVFGETLLDLDGPRHQRLRRPLAGLLLGQRDNVGFRAAAEQRARTAVAALSPDAVLDMVAGPARAVPLTATAAFLGIPAERHDWLLHTVEYLVGHLDGSSGDFARASALRAELEAYLLELISDGAPARSMLAEVHGWVRDGEITDREAVGLATLTLAAGFETSTGLISNTLHCLARFPEHAAPAAADGGRLRAFLKETLRWEPPQHDTVRFARRDTTLAGVPVPAGSALKLMLASGNRDADVFEHPEEFRPDRSTHGSLTFGHGSHSCLGTHIALDVAEAFIGALLARFPGLRAVDDPLPPITGSTFRRPRALRMWLGHEGES
ncbi:cytochrome P450 [Streptomyces sp. NPDC058486]|uniref:cytochrome P450 n=1 Tax=unclassified Streptomyces TaxID=2593676 RepID=UPI0036476D89